MTLLALGLLAAVALPGLSAAFAWRLSNALGVEVEPVRAFEQPIENATRVGVVLDAFRPDSEMELDFEGGEATLRLGEREVPSESVTARHACDAPGCYRGVTLTFLLPAGRGLDGAWIVTGRLAWASDLLGVGSNMTFEARGEGERVVG